MARPHATAVPLNSIHSATLVLLLSGCAALIYQVLWIKQLSLVVGVEVYAITTGISAFFAGLGLGSYVFGRFADRQLRPVLLYALLELAVALLGIATTWLLTPAAAWFVAWQANVGLLAWALPFALVLIPATLMGGTLPVLIHALTPSAEHTAHYGGRLYAANTAGAIVGTLVSAFVLIPAFGMRGSAAAAATLNLVAAVLALGLVRAPGREPAAAAAPSTTRGPRLPLVLYALAGGVALGYELIWTQSIVPFMSTRTFAFAVVLSTYLAGLVLGSALIARRAARVRDPWGLFAVLIAAAGLLALLEIALLGHWLVALQGHAQGLVRALGGSMTEVMLARFAVAAVGVVLLPTLLLGAAFPLALRLCVVPGRVGHGVGAVLAFNTLGGIVGVLLSGLVLVPWLGLVHSLGVLAVAAGLIGLAAVWKRPGVSRAHWRGVVTLALAALVLAAVTPADKLAQLLPGAQQGSLVFYQEGRGGTVAVVTQGQSGRRFNRLYIQGVSNTGDAMPSLRYMRLQALLPLLIHNGEPRSALVIGLGTGITAGALSQYPGLEHRVVAELLPAVVQAAHLFTGNFNAGTDPGLEIRLRDGRRELLGNAQQYDLITLEPPPPSAAGVVNLYSRDFYQLAASRLNEQGLVAQWLPLPTQNLEESRALVRSFLDVFPYATLWTSELHETLLIGSLSPIELDVGRISERFNQPGVRDALQAVGIASPAALLATWLTDRNGLNTFAGEAQAVTDDWPRIEYAPWVSPDELTRTLPALLALQRPLPLVGSSDDFNARVSEHRQRLQQFYRASLHAYQGEREAWFKDMRDVARGDGSNPYYRWFLGSARE
nr:fused MFS/spermidine synthase [Pseudomonas sp. M47T1]